MSISLRPSYQLSSVICAATVEWVLLLAAGCKKGPGGGKQLAIEACSGSSLMLSLKSTKVGAGCSFLLLLLN